MKYKRSHFIGGGILCVLLALALFSGQQLAFRLFALFLFLLALASFAVAIFGKAWRKPREAQPKEEPHREQPAAQPKQEPRGTQPAAQPSAQSDWDLEHVLEDESVYLYGETQRSPYLDEDVTNKTSARWLRVKEESSLREALEEIAQKRQEPRGFLLKRTILLMTPAQAEALSGPEGEQLRGLCAENCVRPMLEEAHFRFRDLLEGGIYLFTYETHPTGVDWSGTALDVSLYKAEEADG